MSRKKIEKALIKMLIQEPFYAAVALGLKFQENSDKSGYSMSTDGVNVWYRAGYVETETPHHVENSVMHEVIHVCSKHFVRGRGKAPDIWNQACDYVVNDIIASSGRILRPDVLWDSKFRGWSEEAIYTFLMGEVEREQQEPSPDEQQEPSPDEQQEPSPDEQQASPNGGSGRYVSPYLSHNKESSDGDVIQTLLTGDALDAAIRAVDQSIVRAAMVARGKGNLPGFAEELISKLLRPKITIGKILNKFMKENNHSRPDWSKPSRRWIGGGVYLPKKTSGALSKGMVVIDSSGSVSSNELQVFLSEIKPIIDTYATEVAVLSVDTAIKDVKIYKRGGVLDMTVRGRGGTDFRPAFEWAKKFRYEPKWAIYFTDGGGDDYPTNPQFPVIWFSTGEFLKKPPFGEVVKIDMQNYGG